MEVLFWIANMMGYSKEELLEKRKEKFEERGRLIKGLYWKGCMSEQFEKRG